MTTTTKTFRRAELRKFIGSETWYRHGLGPFEEVHSTCMT